jgi:cleavage and polyadenylation specificity factor subunit 3
MPQPATQGLNGLPFLDRLEPAEIDVVLITHFHLDHAASLPYLTERTNFKGRIFMTHPTKAVLRLLLGDYLRLLSMNNAKPEDVLYTEADLHSCLSKIELVDFRQTVTVDALSFTALNAGHVLGACMYWMDFNGQRSVLYTGDYSMEDDRHLMSAEVPEASPDVLITESTYGVQVHASRAEREALFTGTIERIVSQGGRCLIPVFALGRAQELLLILDEYWQANAHLRAVPIWYASKLASRALRVYQTYANMMNARIRQQLDVGNPFQFRYIQNLKSIDVNAFDDSQPAVVFASPGMLQSGVSRQLFDRWAANPVNGVVIAGYAVEHTLAKEIMSQPKEVVTLDGRKQPLAASVTTCSFSAHVDFVMNRSFIQQVQPKHILLVHGQKDEMGRLKSALMLQYKSYPESKRPTITMPPNLQEVKLRFARRRSAKVLGRLATQATEEDDVEKDEEEMNTEKETPTSKKARTSAHQMVEPKEGQQVQGILVTHNFQSKLVAPADLATYTPLRVGQIRSRLHVPFGGSVGTLRLFLQEMFAGIRVQDTVEKEMEISTFSLQDKVTVVVGRTTGIATVTWEAHPQHDVLADAVVALIAQAQSSPAAIRLTSQPCRHSARQAPSEVTPEVARTESRLRLIRETLQEQFQNVEAIYEGHSATYEIIIDSGKDGETITCSLQVDFPDGAGEQATVNCESTDEAIAKNVQDCIQGLAAATYPIPIEE